MGNTPTVPTSLCIIIFAFKIHCELSCEIRLLLLLPSTRVETGDLDVNAVTAEQRRVKGFALHCLKI